MTDKPESETTAGLSVGLLKDWWTPVAPTPQTAQAIINELRAEVARLKAKQVADIDETMRLASDFATVYGRLHFARQCGGPITKVGEETEAAREALRSHLAKDRT